jgi:hypothetical protein
MDSQTSATVFLVRPASFAFHADAARTNAFAKECDGDVARAAQVEFDRLRAALEAEGVECIVLDDDPSPARPDAVFPNNWVSFHADGTVVAYPMANPARRAERRHDGLAAALRRHGFAMGRTIDLTPLEDEGRFLEGTGSLVFDRPNRRAYAARSARTSEQAVKAFDDATGFETMVFDAADRQGQPIYHTNVLMSLGSRFALVCLGAVVAGDRNRVSEAIAASGRTMIDVTFEQLEDFACNAIELQDRDGRPLVALSTRALASFDDDQRGDLERLGGRLIAVDIPTIERIGGGSVRCMIADVHLPREGEGR